MAFMKGLSVKPIRYGVHLNGKGVGICVQCGDTWAFMCHLDGQFYHGDTPDAAISRCKLLQDAAAQERKAFPGYIRQA